MRPVAGFRIFAHFFTLYLIKKFWKISIEALNYFFPAFSPPLRMWYGIRCHAYPDQYKADGHQGELLIRQAAI
jgi:hypothetical protein